MKQKERGLNAATTLGAGWAYFVDPFAFVRELERVSSKPQTQEKNTCESSFAAIKRANTQLDQGFAVTGVVAAVIHVMVCCCQPRWPIFRKEKDTLTQILHFCLLRKITDSR